MPRTKGALNKNKNAALLLLQKQLGADFHPLSEMGKMYTESADEPIRAGLLKEMAQYTLPKLKAVEHSGETTQKIMTVAAQIMAAEQDAGDRKD